MSEATAIDTQVFCLLSDSKIAARECVDLQHGSRCFCPKAPSAIVAISAVALPGSKLAEAISTCKDRAQSMLKRPSVERFDGPAARKLRGEAEPSSLIQGELLAPKAPEQFLRKVIEERDREQYVDPIAEADAAREKFLDQQIRLRCSTPGCGTRLNEASAARGDKCSICRKRAKALGGVQTPSLSASRVEHEAAISEQEVRGPGKRLCSVPGCGSLFVSTRYDKCWRCRVGSKKHRANAPDTNEVAEAVEAVEATRAATNRAAKEEPLAPKPAKEKAMKVKTEPCKWTEEKCDEMVWAGSKTGLCGRHGNIQSGRDRRAGVEKKPRKAKAPKKLPRKTNGKKHNALDVLPATNGVAPELGKPIEFKDLPAIETLPVAYLIACAEHLAIARRRIDFALAGQPYLAPRAAES